MSPSVPYFCLRALNEKGQKAPFLWQSPDPGVPAHLCVVRVVVGKGREWSLGLHAHSNEKFHL